jgi:uncharacterized membrane protein YcjF (UPF0283 family)
VENKHTHAARSFLIELMLYAGLVVVYVFFVIAFLGNWLDALYEHHKIRYAFAALLLIVAQGLVLEMVTTILLRLIRRRTD